MEHAYYITGIAGTGKSTTAEALRKYGFAVYDIDAEGICRWRHKQTKQEAAYTTGVGKDWIAAHDYICDEEKLRQLLQKNPDNDTIVVGIASNQEDYFPLFDKVFLLYCDEQTFLERLNTRTGNEFAKDISEQEQILGWYKDFQERMKNRGAVPISTEVPVEEVVQQIRDNI